MRPILGYLPFDIPLYGYGLMLDGVGDRRTAPGHPAGGARRHRGEAGGPLRVLDVRRRHYRRPAAPCRDQPGSISTITFLTSSPCGRAASSRTEASSAAWPPQWRFAGYTDVHLLAWADSVAPVAVLAWRSPGWGVSSGAATSDASGTGRGRFSFQRAHRRGRQQARLGLLAAGLATGVLSPVLIPRSCTNRSRASCFLVPGRRRAPPPAGVGVRAGRLRHGLRRARRYAIEIFRADPYTRGVRALVHVANHRDDDVSGRGGPFVYMPRHRSAEFPDPAPTV